MKGSFLTPFPKIKDLADFAGLDVAYPSLTLRQWNFWMWRVSAVQIDWAIDGEILGVPASAGNTFTLYKANSSTAGGVYTDQITSDTELALHRYNVLGPLYATATPGWNLSATFSAGNESAALDAFNHHFNLGFEPFPGLQMLFNATAGITAGGPTIRVMPGTVGMFAPTATSNIEWVGTDPRTDENFAFSVPMYYDAANGTISNFYFNITAFRFYEYRDAAGLNPTYDVITGAPI